MANKKEIRHHIESVSDTKTITNAMYLIASTKLRKARDDLKKARPYFDALIRTVRTVAAVKGAEKSKYFQKKEEKKIAILVISSDKGLAGGYNHNVLSKAVSVAEGKDVRFFAVGSFARQYFSRRNVRYEKDFVYGTESRHMHVAREIAEIMLELYDNGEVDAIYLVYTDFSGGMSEKIAAERILPITSEASEKESEFFPSEQAVLDGVVSPYLEGMIYGALVDSYCSEQNARMTAMDSANRNAQKLLDELSARYDHVRQNAITQEIIEVSAGARYQKENKHA